MTATIESLHNDRVTNILKFETWYPLVAADGRTITNIKPHGFGNGFDCVIHDSQGNIENVHLREYTVIPLEDGLILRGSY